ncbi:hypothetical protein [Pedobacter sp. BS3]|uniref:hypothetical protein n=1 Tax=Pedobacter sp. BS3 TaxID=2567937 RepID=UPI001F5B6D6E|nr:hypothetical protein [Pedobacter sp. BS3]
MTKKVQLKMKKILTTGFAAGIILFVISYGILYLAIKFFPEFFVAYNNPLFNSDGSRDVLFYLHAFIISLALAWFWDRFKRLFHGTFIVRGIEFGFVYAIIALLPVMWITFSALDITVSMVVSWFVYGFLQAVIAGMIFARINP